MGWDHGSTGAYGAARSTSGTSCADPVGHRPAGNTDPRRNDATDLSPLRGRAAHGGWRGAECQSGTHHAGMLTPAPLQLS